MQWQSCKRCRKCNSLKLQIYLYKSLSWGWSVCVNYKTARAEHSTWGKCSFLQKLAFMCYYLWKENKKPFFFFFAWKRKQSNKALMCGHETTPTRLQIIGSTYLSLSPRSKRSPFWIKSWNCTDKGSRLKSTNSFQVSITGKHISEHMHALSEIRIIKWYQFHPSFWWAHKTLTFLLHLGFL